ncbi:MAG TPA: hypothetical protein PLS90_06360 [Candidatus Sumerlaeota bacterium]|nr:MAG: hypothetical protein BWZ08_00388 [candidate division BRC1 bacterium ADurb.BinA292]HOE96212.1 hypothetical protein [Candidatus Sumerlaeota bacterium]HOR27572.1 hypothetical protein [Candidatus Sumerlaeota bacterium]HPK02063.1 hypothetical protein [Candidatus Sumerlaeota bacterium]
MLYFGQILDRVERGERVAVLRNGRHVATIIPARPAPDAVKQYLTGFMLGANDSGRWGEV